MDREALIEYVKDANTVPEIRHAEALLDEWARHHPDDVGVLDYGETLCMLRLAIEGRSSDVFPTPVEVNRRLRNLSGM